MGHHDNPDAEHGHCVESGCSPCTGAEFVQELQLPIRNAKANATKPGQVKQNKTSTSFANQLSLTQIAQGKTWRRSQKERTVVLYMYIWQHLHNEAVDVDPRDRQENTSYVLRLLRAV